MRAIAGFHRRDGRIATMFWCGEREHVAPVGLTEHIALRVCAEKGPGWYAPTTPPQGSASMFRHTLVWVRDPGTPCHVD